MKNKPGELVRTTIFCAILLLCSGIVRSQNPTPTPNPADASTAKKDAEAAAKPVPETGAPKPAVAPEPDLWHREELTGDWDGARSRWKEKGFEMNFKLTQFFQGVATGGLEQGSEYNGKFETEFKFDFGKMAGWNFWSAQIKTETRFGGPSVGRIGTLTPVNTAAISPGLDGEVFAITAANITKLFPIDLAKGELIALSVGRFNTLDLIAEDFFGGAGTTRFFHIAQNGGLTAAREVPLVTNGAVFAYLRAGQPFITLAVLDPNDHSTDVGLSDLFADGVSFVPGITFPTKYFGKSASHSFGGAITTKKYTPFDSLRQIVIPGPPIVPVEAHGGSWSINYTFRQYLVERGPKNGWGFFGQVAFANEKTSPVTSFVMFGLGGNGLFKARGRDEFGIAYSYSGLSDVLKDGLDPLTIGRLRAEHQFETFYNFYITPWLRLTGDLQVIRPTRPIADTAIIPGARLEIIF